MSQKQSIARLLPRFFLSLVGLLCFALVPAQAATHPTAHAQSTAAAHSAKKASAAKVTASQVAKARPDVRVNRASADELSEALIGVGPSKARAIVAYRKTHGAFKSLDDLSQVKGVGPSILKKNKAHILFN